MTRYSHAYDFAFEIESDHPDGEDLTPAMIRAALIKRATEIDDAEVLHACGLFDTHEILPSGQGRRIIRGE